MTWSDTTQLFSQIFEGAALAAQLEDLINFFRQEGPAGDFQGRLPESGFMVGPPWVVRHMGELCG
jgi:hypothetical protein